MTSHIPVLLAPCWKNNAGLQGKRELVVFNKLENDCLEEKLKIQVEKLDSSFQS